MASEAIITEELICKAAEQNPSGSCPSDHFFRHRKCAVACDSGFSHPRIPLFAGQRTHLSLLRGSRSTW